MTHVSINESFLLIRDFRPMIVPDSRMAEYRCVAMASARVTWPPDCARMVETARRMPAPSPRDDWREYSRSRCRRGYAQFRNSFDHPLGFAGFIDDRRHRRHVGSLRNARDSRSSIHDCTTEPSRQQSITAVGLSDCETVNKFIKKRSQQVAYFLVGSLLNASVVG